MDTTVGGGGGGKGRGCFSGRMGRGGSFWESGAGYYGDGWPVVV